MFRIPFGKTSRYCDGLSRRSFLQIGVAGMGALSLSQVRALAQGRACP